MDKFPDYLSVSSKHLFSSYMETNIMSKLRNKIYEFILTGNEDDYFVLGNFYRSENINNNTQLTTRITDTIINELTALGWTTKLAFGGTGLYIYSTQDHKSTYFEDIIA